MSFAYSRGGILKTLELPQSRENDFKVLDGKVILAFGDLFESKVFSSDSVSESDTKSEVNNKNWVPCIIDMPDGVLFRLWSEKCAINELHKTNNPEHVVSLRVLKSERQQNPYVVAFRYRNDINTWGDMFEEIATFLFQKYGDSIKTQTLVFGDLLWNSSCNSKSHIKSWKVLEDCSDYTMV